MTLIKKMFLGVLVMLFLVFIGTYLITMNNARNFFIQQMESNAQDTATSLGLSLSQSFLNHNMATMNSMVQAVFDRGYFSSIEVKDIRGKIIVSKKQLPKGNTVPGWFVHLIRWPATDKSSLVMNGWRQAGFVLVTTDSGYAYFSLWANAVEMVKCYIIFAVVALVLAYGFIQLLLRPLKRVTAQALAISEHEFPIESNIPKTPELKQVTVAMNQMVAKIRSLFQTKLQQAEALRIQVYQDPLTEMSNRRHFLQQLSSILENEDEFIPGYIVMIVIDGLNDLNQQQGYQQGDKLVLTVARICKEFWQQPSVNMMARISGSTFALINNEQDPLTFQSLCNEFIQRLGQEIKSFAPCEIYVGAADYFVHQSVSNLLTMVDLSIKRAREEGVFYCQKEHETFRYPHLFAGEEIKKALQQKSMNLYVQDVTNTKKKMHKEVFVRIPDQAGGTFGAGYFMPLAEKLSLAHLIDLYVLHELTAQDIAARECFALNISENTLLNKEHSKKYLSELQSLPEVVRKNLSLEINEAFLFSNFSKVKLFVKQAKQLGVTIGIDRVGIHFAPLHYLSDLPIDYLKLHGSLIQDIGENESKQFFIHYFNEMAKTMDIQVVATQIEQQAQWDALQIVHVVWGQGRYLAAVEPLN